MNDNQPYGEMEKFVAGLIERQAPGMKAAPILSERAAEWINGPHTCGICRKQYTGWGNNPEPIKPYQQRCCDECNTKLVVPWRVEFGRNFEPSWVHCGKGKSPFERVICNHPFHDPGYGFDKNGEMWHNPAYGEDPRGKHPITLPDQDDIWRDQFYRGGIEENTGDVWYGKRPKDGDEIGQVINQVLGQTKSNYGLTEAK